MTDERLILALAQINLCVGDFPGNLEKIRKARRQAAEAGADILVTPELSISGYPPEDLALKPAFLDRARAAVEALAADTIDRGPAVILGAPWRIEGREPVGRPWNAILVLDGGRVQAVRAKWDLPNYGVFDERRVFAQGDLQGPVNIRGLRLGAMVCEDLWTEEVSETLEESGAELLLAINASPFEEDKGDQRLQVALQRASETGLPVIYLNLVGGQDELVFDGASFVLDAGRNLRCQLPAFEEQVAFVELTREAEGAWQVAAAPVVEPASGLGAVYSALVLGLRDYVEKNGFPGVLIGLSGGLDSALTLTVAVDALGAERVRCVMMPSPYTSRESLEDAVEAARLNGVRLDEISIEPAMAAFGQILAPVFEGRAPDVTEENLQARARGMVLMAISNKLGPLVLSTGNKSELSVGYSTLYGDMCGGFNVLKDVYKTEAMRLAAYRNEKRPKGALGPDGRVVPERVLTKPPSAELRPDQKDEDSLPPYALLDRILTCLIERDMGVQQIVDQGFDRATVSRVWRMLESAEYKRRQAPPGVKVTSRAFGRDRRYPITNAFKSEA